MNPDAPESPRLKDHFPATRLDVWVSQTCQDLGIASLDDVAWGPDGGPTIAPLTRSGPAVPIRTRPGWRYAEVIETPSAEVVASGLAEARAGAADLVILHCGAGGLQTDLLPALLDSAGLPVVVSIGCLSSGSAQIMSDARIAGYLVDPVAGHLRGEGDLDLEPALASFLTDTGRRCFAVDLRAWEEAGATPVDLAAVAFAATSEWMVALTQRGLSGNEAAATLSVIVPVSHELFPSIGLLRAIRAGLETVVRAFDASTPIEIVGVTASDSLQEREPYTNLIRTTTAAVASVLGAVDVLSVRPFDPAEPAESDRGRRLARNIAHLLRHEGHLDKVADPAAGSYYVEAMTRELGAAAWGLFGDWEREGGLLAVLSHGALRERLRVQKTEKRQRIEDGRITRIGVNHQVEAGAGT